MVGIIEHKTESDLQFVESLSGAIPGVSMTHLDLRIGAFCRAYARRDPEAVWLAAALLSRNLRDGDVCLDLDRIAQTSVPVGIGDRKELICPAIAHWIDTLNHCDCVGVPGDFKPLILDQRHRLYFQRYWQYEKDVADNVLARLNHKDIPSQTAQDLAAIVSRFFPKEESIEINWQKIAVAAACLRRFLVISGSPGTGKTTTVVKILMILQQVHEGRLRIALAAPTGKAAAKLKESIGKMNQTIADTDPLFAGLPKTATTLHRLLGGSAKTPYFRYDSTRRLPYDLVVVDEASMIDLPMMAKLMSALEPEARLILLGDKDQLASVDAGYVLGSICRSLQTNAFSAAMADQISDMTGVRPPVTTPDPPAAGVVIELQHNYRFDGRSGIGRLSALIKQGDGPGVMAMLCAKSDSDIHYMDLLSGRPISEAVLLPMLAPYLNFTRFVRAQTADLPEVFDLFESFRILCALRHGPWGSREINLRVENILSGQGLIDIHKSYYLGRPVMIVENDYRLNLFNGDTGLIINDGPSGPIRAFFRMPDGEIRKISPGRLPRHETAWAMTVHKSQGSEFDHVVLIAPPADFPPVTRELLYTGVTRARREVTVIAGRNLVEGAVGRCVQRQSGLSEMLDELRDIGGRTP